MTSEEVAEDQPLLDSTTVAIPESSTPESSELLSKLRNQSILVLLLISIAGCMVQAPQERLYESVICKQYRDPLAIREHGEIPEMDCKENNIQNHLTMILAYQDGFDMFASTKTASIRDSAANFT